MQRDAVVVHDGTDHPGGAVDVVLAAAEVLDADLVVGFSGRDRSWWEQRAPNDVRVLTYRTRLPTLRDAYLAWKWLRLDLREYDLVLSSGPATKFYQPHDGQDVYHYMHHPPLGSLWFDGGMVAYALKVLDRIETWSIPTVIANSELTAGRMVAQYDREPDAVVNPPVDVERFSADREKEPGEVVMVGRLEDRKRPRVAVEAFRRLADRDPTPRLTVVGDGPLRSKLERAAPENVRFLGYAAADELVRAVERASAGLFLARREDFGIVPIEYLAAGTPVVGVDEPNTNNQVVEGETGVLVEPDPESVAAGVRRALDGTWDRERLREAARGYDRAAFDSGLTAVIDG